MKKIIVCAMIGSLFFWGCGQEEKEAETTQPGSSQTVVDKKKSAKLFADKITAVVREKGGALVDKVAVTTGTLSEKAMRSVDAAKVKAGELSEAAQEKAEQLSSQLEKGVGEAAEKVDEMAVVVKKTGEQFIEKATEATEDLGKELEQTVEAGKKKVAEIAENAQKKSEELAAKASKTGDAVSSEINKKVNNVKQSAKQLVAEVTAPAVVIMENKKGTVTLPHKMHSDSFACAVCHGDGTPGAMELGKKESHKICKSCHKEKKAGPTKCSGCHAKK